MKIERTMQCLVCGEQFTVKFEDQTEADTFNRAGAVCPSCNRLAGGWYTPKGEDNEHSQ